MAWIGIGIIGLFGVLGPDIAARSAGQRALAAHERALPRHRQPLLVPFTAKPPRTLLVCLLGLTVLFLSKNLLAGPAKAVADHGDPTAGLPWSDGMTAEARATLGGYLLDAMTMAAVVGYVIGDWFLPSTRSTTPTMAAAVLNWLRWIAAATTVWLHSRVTGDPLPVSAAVLGLAMIGFWLLTHQAMLDALTLRQKLIDKLKAHVAGDGPDRIREIGEPPKPVGPPRIRPLIAWLLLGLFGAAVTVAMSWADVAAQASGNSIALTVGLMASAAAGEWIVGRVDTRADRMYHRIPATPRGD